MKLIFLDVDGVLNYGGCKARSTTGCLGVEEEKLQLLKRIVDETGAEVVLTSTWKMSWSRQDRIEDIEYEDGRYLEEKMRNFGIRLLDKTTDPSWEERGRGILNFIDQLCIPVETFIIIDDESFDFKSVGIYDKFVKTSFVDGLLPEHVERAVSILNDCKF